MRRGHFEAFRPHCPACAAAGREIVALSLVHVSDETSVGVQSGLLRCALPACQHEFPIIAGVPVIVPDLARLLAERGVELLLRDDLDPLLEGVLGDAIGPDSWFDALRQMLSTYAWDGYADLDPEEPAGDGPLPGAARRCLSRLVALAGAPAGVTRVLDLGCAAGRTSFCLADAHPDALVLGVDLHLGLLRLAQQALGGTVSYPRRRLGLVYDRRRFPVSLDGAARVDFWACDALALPLRAGSIDGVAALNLLDCVADPRGLLAVLAALLRPGGRALLATPFDWSTRATRPDQWIGGHSQRGETGGDALAFLRTLLTPRAHARGVPGLSLQANESWPWHTRLHDRSAVSYRTELLVLARDD